MVKTITFSQIVSRPKVATALAVGRREDRYISSRFLSPEPVFISSTISSEARAPLASSFGSAAAVAAPSGHMNTPSSAVTSAMYSRISSSDTVSAPPPLSRSAPRIR